MTLVSAKLALTLVAELTGTADLSTPVDKLDYAKRINLTDGSGANQGNMVWHDRRTLAPSASEDLDLAGALVNALGATQAFARIKGVVVTTLTGNTNNVNVTRPAANGVPLFLAASDGIAVPPGGLFAWAAPTAAGVAVTPGTGDLLTITNSAGVTPVTYDVIVIGANA